MRALFMTCSAIPFLLAAPSAQDAATPDSGVQETATQDVLTGEAAFGGVEDDAVGTRRHITRADLPPPATMRTTLRPRTSRTRRLSWKLQ